MISGYFLYNLIPFKTMTAIQTMYSLLSIGNEKVNIEAETMVAFYLKMRTLLTASDENAPRSNLG